MSQPTPHTSQPAPAAPMSEQPRQESLMSGMGQSYAKGAAKEAGKETIQYTQTPDGQTQIDDVQNKAQQEMDDAKAKAQGLWSKYCGCFGSVA